MQTALLVEKDLIVRGAIVDSWIERGGREPKLVLQVRPWGRSQELWIVEASPSLVPDTSWLEDLSGNLCHGSAVKAAGRLRREGFVAASRLELDR